MGMGDFSGSSDIHYEVVNTTSALTTRHYATYNGDIHTIVYSIWLRNKYFGCLG